MTIEFSYRSAKYRAIFGVSKDPAIEILVHAKGWQGVKSPDKGILKAAGKAQVGDSEKIGDVLTHQVNEK